ncbi:HK97 gp10 family phage protein [Paenibacillus sp. 1011MAR3C5]|uniref:HK97 gp10 family phage protein n=1 Tax=Paenibacillus sp. 1011MAR3C5 TaxID=1675787 RepID=UPI000E6CE360|nr:HK97 gp10 family phage protein [Paenibacillus sp. 1011MAR3C5]RJE88623.1 HK97 gp10 family phage protein [Paenibacillus sp. 1011MAR3C5]
MARNTQIIGQKELERDFKKLGKAPQTIATQSARAGANVAFKAAKRNAPVESGNLKSGLIMKRERRVKAGKAVYDIMMDPAKTHLYVSVSKDGKRSYYPASQEYGFMTDDGRYIPGYRYLRRSIDENVREIEQKTLEKAGKLVDKLLKARG